MVEWEYLVLGLSLEASYLNKFGADGWELVHIGNGFMYFKRPVIEAPKAAPKTVTSARARAKR